MSVGAAQGCVDESVKYARERSAFGQPISRYQAVEFKIARMAARAHAARTAYYDAAALMLSGKPFKKEAAIAKLVASEAAMDNARDATQIHGGYGFMNEYLVARHYRDSKILEIGEGTTEVQLMVIARQLGLCESSERNERSERRERKGRRPARAMVRGVRDRGALPARPGPNHHRGRQRPVHHADDEHPGTAPGRGFLRGPAPFHQRLVNSMFTLSTLVGLSVAQLTQGTIVGNLGFSEIAFPKPLFHGDTMYAETVVTDKRESRSRPGEGIVTFAHTARNQHGDIVATATRKAMVRCRPAAEEA